MISRIYRVLCVCVCIVILMCINVKGIEPIDENNIFVEGIENIKYWGVPQKELNLIINHETETENPRTKYTEREILILSKIALAEAKTEGVEGMVYVMQTVLNRVESEKFPDTIEAVVFQDGQFSTIGNGAYNKAQPNSDSDAALDSLSDFDNFGQLFFESVSCEGTWASRNREAIRVYRNHRFYR